MEIRIKNLKKVIIFIYNYNFYNAFLNIIYNSFNNFNIFIIFLYQFFDSYNVFKKQLHLDLNYDDLDIKFFSTLEKKQYKILKKNFFFFKKRDFIYKKFLKNFFLIDFILIFLNKRNNILIDKNNFNKIHLKFIKTKNNSNYFFNNIKFDNKYNNFIKKFNMRGYYYLYNFFKLWFLPLILFFSISYFFLFLKSLPFGKIIFLWFSLLMFFYWLLSGFVFFFKKYQFGKYTSSIQRFWRRTYMIFWLIEGSTFLVFLFFTINSSQESFYMFDQTSVFKSHLYSWKLFFLKLFPLVMLIILTYTFMLSIKWNIFSKHSLIIFFITFFLTYTVWLEFYQFFHVLNYYSNLNWIYDLDDNSWSLESDSRKSRMVNHYVMLLFILKFWHIIFIYSFWLFFVLRSLEIKRVRFSILSANFQNFIILYIFAWVYMYPWFKFFFRKFLDSPYYWFYINNRKLFFRVFFYDFKLIYYGLISYFDSSSINIFNIYNFYYYKISDSTNNFEFFKKNYIKNNIIKSINK